MKQKPHLKLPSIRAITTSRGFFFLLAAILLAITVVFVVYHLIFVFNELNKAFGREDQGEAPTTFNIEGFKKLNLIRQQ
ncbi:MAG: hypothetical protein Q7J22_01450 [Candidatus Wolfebacteria bacterium]|nr:hypothetical protein [Candidatus Wolfebacteria bacterium]MDP2704345.1 hypothetical protein [bacterium]